MRNDAAVHAQLHGRVPGANLLGEQHRLVAKVAATAAEPAEHPALLNAAAVRCPVMMLAGNDDQLWPSVQMARMLSGQRAAAGVDAGDDCRVYDGAGHLIRLGLLPTDAPWTNGIAFGGSREGLARAQADATAVVLRFLSRV